MKKILLFLILIICLTGCTKYSCPNGYNLDGKKCSIDVVEEVKTKQVCDSNYTLENNNCMKEISLAAKTKETCPKGYKNENHICILVSTQNANKKTWCVTGTYKNGACYTFSTIDAVLLGQSCPEGSNSDGFRCFKRKKTKPSQTAYGTPTCLDGETLEFGSCIKKIYVDKIDNYVCYSGTLKGKKCEISTWIGMPKIEYSCPNGYNLIGEKCSKTDVKNTTIKYSCDKGYELKGTSCVKYISQKPTEVQYCDNELLLIDDKCYGKKTIDAIKG